MDKSKMLENMLEVLRKSDPERLARLEGMGADTSKIMFHGTGENRSPFNRWENPVPFDEFQNRTTFLSPDSDFAGTYATGENARIMPVFAPKANYFDPKNPQHLERLKNFLLKENVMGTETGLEFDRLEKLQKLNEKNKDNWGNLANLSHLIKKAGWPGYKETEYGIENLAVFEPYRIKSIWAKGKGLGLLGGFAAMPNMNPLEDLRKFVDKYREVQGPLADRITEEVSKPFGGADEGLKTLGRIGFDPLNVGAAGEIMGVIELLTPEQKKEKLMKSMEKK